MPSSYNQIAGHSVERLAALSDGIFAVAMTILVLDLHAPVAVAIHGERDLQHALVALAPRFLVYLMSFMSLGIFWVGQQTQLNHLERSDRSLTWVHIAFLCLVCLVPFSTAVLGEFIEYRTALIQYWMNILLLGVALYFSWICATHGELVKEDLPANVAAAIRRRIVMAQALYAVGALLCIFSTYASIVFIVLVQLNYSVAPRLPGMRKPSTPVDS